MHTTLHCVKLTYQLSFGISYTKNINRHTGVLNPQHQTTQAQLITKLEASPGPFYKRRLTLMPAWMNNNMFGKEWDKTTYPFPNVKVTPLKFGNVKVDLSHIL